MFDCVHIDYIEQYLIDFNTCLLCLKKLYIQYENLVTITENFTRNETHATCSKLKHIILGEGIILHLKEFHLYFLFVVDKVLLDFDYHIFFCIYQ